MADIASRVRDLALEDLTEQCRAGRLQVDYGAALVRVRSAIGYFVRAFQVAYGSFRLPQASQAAFADYHIEIVRPRGLRAIVRPQSQFYLDGIQPFDPFPVANALPLFEWGVNWCFGKRGNQFVLLHAAVLAKGSQAIIMAAPPGSGKSTLAAAMMLRGFRLLSDEFGVLQPDSGTLLAMLKPVALKNQSVDVIRAFSDQAMISTLYKGTRKGDVAHLAPNDASADAIHSPAQPALVIFPSFEPGAALDSRRLPGEDAFAHLAFNSFNYHLLGAIGFEAVADVIAACPAYALRYSDLDAAIGQIDRLLDEASAETAADVD